jgi:hypothetical protein
MLPFNVNDGFLDGIVRGFRATLIKSNDYLNMTQCETLEGNMEIFKCGFPWLSLFHRCEALSYWNRLFQVYAKQ